MRILYISYVTPESGPWVHTQQFFLALKTLHADAVLYPSITGRDQSSSIRDLQASKRQPKPFRGIRFFLSAFIKKAVSEAKDIKRLHPDIIILRGGPYLSSIPLSSLNRIPLLLEVNAPIRESLLWDSRHRRLKNVHVWEPIERKILKMTTHVIAVSEPLRTLYIERGITPSKITAVPNGVDVNMFNPTCGGSHWRKKLGLENKIVVGFSGHFSPWHGLDFLFRTMANLLSQPGKVALLLIGAAKKFFSIPSPPNGSVVFSGRVHHSQMPALLSAVDIFVAPYPRIDPFYFSPLKVFEAMSMGKAVLASAQGQICDLITDGLNGLLHVPDDEAGFLKRLQLLIDDEDLRNELGKAARERIVNNFTWEHSAKAIMGLCQSICNHPGRES